MPVSSNYFLVGKLEIKLDELTISFYSDGYSLADLEKEPVEKKFTNPKPLKEVISQKEIEKVEETQKLLKQNISLFNNQTLEIELYEPPLTITKEIDEDKAIIILSSPTSLIPTPCLMFKENASYYLILESIKEDKEIFSIELSNQTIKNYLTPYKGKEKGYILNFGNQLFYCYLIIKKEEKEFLKIPIFVYPRKLKLEEVEKILIEILEWQAKLIYDLEPTGLTLKPGEYEKCIIQKLNFIRYLFKKRNLKGILNSIIENPHKILTKKEVLKEISEVETPVPHLLLDLATESTAIKKTSSNYYHFEINNRYLFTKTYEEISKISYDTYPNRFVKFFLKFLKQELKDIEESLNENSIYEKYFKWIKNGREPSLEEMKRIVNQILNKDFFKEVSDIFHFASPPQILLKEYRYREIFSAYLDLIRGLKFLRFELEELLLDPIKNMPELYEYWCFLKLWQTLEEVLEIKGTYQEKLITNDEFGTKLRRNIEVKFNEEIILSYNKSYTKDNQYSSYSLCLRPDFTLKINDYLIIFDAKYRIEWIEEIEKAEENLDKIIKEEKLGTFVLGDLYKIHTYREALFYKEIKNKPIWVIALYPGDKLELFPENKENLKIKDIKDFLEYIINNKIDIGGVGAIPLKPHLVEN